MCQRKACPDLEHCLSATFGIKASPAPNLQNCKSLNFQGKIKRKSKVSKLSDVENVETVEADEATNGYKEMEAVTLDQHIGVRIPRGKQFFSTICGQNSRVPFIPGCGDPRVT
jgi:gamma-glutamyl phosphate reductase